MKVKIQKMKKSIFCVVFLVCAQACFAQLSESWHTTYNGQGDFTDRYTCMIAADGFVYLGGSTQSADQNQDFLVVKTDIDGTLLWRKQFHGSGTGPDEFKSIAKHNDTTGMFRAYRNGKGDQKVDIYK